MKKYPARTQLATHDVLNQPPLMGDFSLLADPAFDKVRESLTTPQIEAYGKWAGSSDARENARLANEVPPVLTVFDPRGYRLDEVQYHPSYHRLLKKGIEAGVSAGAWNSESERHQAHGMMLYMTCWADSGVCCPMSMTYAATSVLKEHEWTSEIWLGGVTSSKYDSECKPFYEKLGLTMGMAMTEKQGGSDLRANTTVAKVSANGEASLVGHKWFCSAPMSDGFLTLAKEEKGLSCFLVPKWRPDGVRNAIELQRLKDKMGDRSNASSEIEYRHAWAKRVGEPGRGIATIINMAHHTRFDCISGSAGGMRKAVAIANHFATHRAVFGRRLLDQPLMRHTLADLALESEAAIALCLKVGASFDAEKGSETSLLSRVLTPVSKYWVCKRQPNLVAEALECMGGVGFVEESGMPLLYRTAPLNSVWEGSGNVIALDIQRALRNAEVLKVFTDALHRIGREVPQLRDWTDWLSDFSVEKDPRLFAERSAIVFAASALSPGPLRDAWIMLRVTEPTLIWGANGAKVDIDFILDRLAIYA